MMYERYIGTQDDAQVYNYRKQIVDALNCFPIHLSMERLAETIQHIAANAIYDLIPLCLIGIPVVIDAGKIKYVIRDDGIICVIDK